MGWCVPAVRAVDQLRLTCPPWPRRNIRSTWRLMMENQLLMADLLADDHFMSVNSEPIFLNVLLPFHRLQFRSPFILPQSRFVCYYDRSNQTQTTLFNCMMPSAGGVNSFRPCFLSEYFCQNRSICIWSRICIIGGIPFTAEFPPFTQWR